MKLTNKELINFLNKMSGLKSKKMPMAILRSVILTHKDAQLNYDVYEEQLKKLFDDYAIRNQAGEMDIDASTGLPKIREDSIHDFNTSLDELLNLEVTIKDHKFNEALLDSWDEIKYDALTPDDLETLLMMADL